LQPEQEDFEQEDPQLEELPLLPQPFSCTFPHILATLEELQWTHIGSVASVIDFSTVKSFSQFLQL
jgi:hypothetical protein